MKVLQASRHGDELHTEEMATPEPTGRQVLVKINASGVCHTDIHAVDGDWSFPSMMPLVPGHEGVGTVVKMGDAVTNLCLGDRIGIPWLYSSCMSCEFCTTGRETYCSAQLNTGYTIQGCFGEYMLADSAFAVKIPDNLDDSHAAPVLCAGVTTYTAIKNTGLRPGQFLTIIGAAGGLGHMAVQYAKAMGLRVIGIDVGQDKLAFIMKMGAELSLDGTDPSLLDKISGYTKGGSHGVLCLAASLSALRSCLSIVRKCGTVVFVGLPKGDLPINLLDVVLKGVTLKGSLVGTREDMREALDFAERGLVRANIEVRNPSSINKIFGEMRQGTVNGRVVMDMNEF